MDEVRQEAADNQLFILNGTAAASICNRKKFNGHTRAPGVFSNFFQKNKNKWNVGGWEEFPFTAHSYFFTNSKKA